MSDTNKPEFSLDQFSEAETDEEFGLPEFRDHFADTLTPAVLRDWTAKDFASIYVRFRPHLERHARRFLVNSSQVEEVVQDAFLYLMTSLPELDSELGVLKFLKWKVRLICIDVIRSEGRATLSSLDLIEDLPSRQSEPSEQLERAEDAAVVALALSKLSPRHQEALLLTAHAGKSSEEAGYQMGLSPNAFRQLLYRARASFKDALVGEIDARGLRTSDLLSIAARKAARSSLKATSLALILGLVVGVTYAANTSGADLPTAQTDPTTWVTLRADPAESLVRGSSVGSGSQSASQANVDVEAGTAKIITPTSPPAPLQQAQTVLPVSGERATAPPNSDESQQTSGEIISYASNEEDELLRLMLEEAVLEATSTLGGASTSIEESFVDDLPVVSIMLSPTVELSFAMDKFDDDFSGSNFALLTLHLPSGDLVRGVPQVTLTKRGVDEFGRATVDFGFTDFFVGDFDGGYGFVATDKSAIANWKVLVQIRQAASGFDMSMSVIENS